MTIGSMRMACWIPKATNTQSEYVILIAFLLQRWLHDAPQCYVCMYIACLVKASFLNLGGLRNCGPWPGLGHQDNS
jgi:hypothetical protein